MMSIVSGEPESKPAKPLSRSDAAILAEQIGDLLADPAADLSALDRARYEGALTVLEAVLGRRAIVA